MAQLAIAIPTRNRADLAMEAVESVLRAAHPSVTVFVSDNSTEPEESDRLEDFCGRQPAERLAYVRPPEPLPMAEHWEWLWRRSRAVGAHTHLAYLTDRMVFTAGAIEELMEIVERHPEHVISYHHDRVEDADVPVQLVQTQWTGQLIALDNRRLIELSSRGEWGDHLPRMLNSISPMTVLEAIEQRFGNVFLSIAPDYCFAYRCLATVDTTLYLDRACSIHRGVTRSAGITYMRGRPNEAAARFERELPGPRFAATPEPAFETNANAIFQEYCVAREDVGDDAFPPPDWLSYLKANAISVDRTEDPERRARMRELLARHGWTRRRSGRHALTLAAEMAGYFIRHPAAFARSVKRQLIDRPPGTPLAFLLPRVGVNPRIREELTFDTTADAIAYADRHPRPRTPYAWHVHRLSRADAVVQRSPSPARR